MYDVRQLSGRIMVHGANETHPLTVCGDVLRVTVLAFELAGEWPTSSRTSAAHKVFAINQRMGWGRALRSLGG